MKERPDLAVDGELQHGNREKLRSIQCPQPLSGRNYPFSEQEGVPWGKL